MNGSPDSRVTCRTGTARVAGTRSAPSGGRTPTARPPCRPRRGRARSRTTGAGSSRAVSSRRAGPSGPPSGPSPAPPPPGGAFAVLVGEVRQAEVQRHRLRGGVPGGPVAGAPPRPAAPRHGDVHRVEHAVRDPAPHRDPVAGGGGERPARHGQLRRHGVLPWWTGQPGVG